MIAVIPARRPLAAPRPWRVIACALVGLASLVAVACRARPRAPPRRADAALEILVEQHQGDQWQVEYRFPTAVDEVRFVSHPDGLRSREWTIVQAHAPDGAAVRAQWTRTHGHERVIAVDPPARLASLTLRFSSHFEPPAKDYALNHAFSDGGRLLYLGHLQVATQGDASCTWQLRTAAERQIASGPIASGVRSGQGMLRWSLPCASPDASTYVYFGDQTPTVGPHLSSIIDPQLPSWLRRETARLVPRLMDHFTASLGIPLDFHPLLLLSFGGASEPGRRFVGGTAARGLQAAVSGSGWSQPTPQARAAWCTTLAHELFHLWNGEMFGLRSDDPSEEWLTEGSADYFALRGAEAVGCVTMADVRRRVVEATNACMARRHGRPLVQAPSEGDFESLYACGMMAIHGVDAAVGRRTAGAGAAQVFARMFEAASARGGRTPTYGTYDLLEATHTLAADQAAVVALERLLHVGIDGAVELHFRDALREAGLAVELVAPSDATLRARDVGDLLAAHLVRCRCTSGCEGSVPPADADRLPVAVAGVAVSEVPTAALDALMERVREGAPVELQPASGPARTLQCPAPASAEHGTMLRLRE